MADGGAGRAAAAAAAQARRALESGRAAIQAEAYDNAIATLSAYLKRARGAAEHSAALARAHLGKDEPRKAIAALRSGIARFGAHPLLLNFLVSVAFAVGDFNLVKDTFRRIERRHLTAATLAMYFAAEKFEVSDELFALVAGAVENPGLGPDDFRQLAGALAKAHLRRGDPAAAFRCVRRLNESYPVPDPERLRRNVTGWGEAPRAAKLVVEPARGGLPPVVFIVGLPRSGSTLLSQALSANREAAGIGEAEAAPRALSAAIGTLEGVDPARASLAEINEAMDEAALRRFRAAYLHAARQLRGARAEPVLIDKQLGNFRLVAFLARAFPDAWIIHAYRHPLDCLLSIMERALGPAHAYKRDPETLIAYFRAYQRLMDIWEKRFPERLIPLCHEAYVEAFEEKTRVLLERFGLPFDPACFAPERNIQTVRTSSAAQVREPVNRSSFGKWRLFEQELQPLIAALGGLEAIEADYARRRAASF